MSIVSECTENSSSGGCSCENEESSELASERYEIRLPNSADRQSYRKTQASGLERVKQKSPLNSTRSREALHRFFIWLPAVIAPPRASTAWWTGGPGPAEFAVNWLLTELNSYLVSVAVNNTHCLQTRPDSTSYPLRCKTNTLPTFREPTYVCQRAV
ncbi:unnamed protein product [Leuciscus chuanchicus]